MKIEEVDIDDDDLDEDDLPPMGLTPTITHEERLEKIRQANLQWLGKEEPRYKKPRLGNRRVRFSEINRSIMIEEDVFEEREVTENNLNMSQKSKQNSKILLVTVPTGYSNDSEELVTDEDDNDEVIETIHDDFRVNVESRGSPKFFESQVSEDVSSVEDEVDRCTPLLTDTISSSVETVLCRSETEESELTEYFSKSITINPDNEDFIEENQDSLESFDFLNLFKEEESNNPKGDLKDAFESSHSQEIDKLQKGDLHRPTTGISVKIIRKPQINDVKKDLMTTINNKHILCVTRKIFHNDPRPMTAPAKRACCNLGGTVKLPSYNGLRSEYGLSEEQLKERERRKLEVTNTLRIEKERKYIAEKIKRKENELTFNNWLIKKKREAEAKAMRRLRQSNYCFRTMPAPTAHLDKIGILRRKMLKRENTCFILNEIFRNAKPQEQKTYQIYLGLRSQ